MDGYRAANESTITIPSLLVLFRMYNFIIPFQERLVIKD